jgi:hypothetical protein
MRENCLVMELRAVAEMAARDAVAAENGGWDEARLCVEDVRKKGRQRSPAACCSLRESRAVTESRDIPPPLRSDRTCEGALTWN